MTTQSWHADPALLAAYVAGALDAVNGASVEQHLVRCAECRASITPARRRTAARAGLGRRPRRACRAPPLPLPVRLARRCGVSEPTSVLLAATASLRTAWLASAFVAVGFATAAVVLAGEELLAPFLLVAPLVPVLGVAAAYGPHEDPLESLIVTAPYGRTRLILLRTLGVLVSVLPFTVALGLLLPGPSGSRSPGSVRRSRWCRCCWRCRASSARASAPPWSPSPGAASCCCRCACVPATWPVEADPAARLPRPGRRGVRRPRRPVPSRPADRSSAVNAVELTGVTKTYGRTRALAGVDLAFDRGVTGLLGPNGAGKTTLLRIVATSIAADGGQVQPARARPARLARRGHRDPSRARLPAAGARLPQRHDRLRLRRVRRRPQGVERPRPPRSREVRRVLDLVGLSDLAAKKVSKLSGGQRRRVGAGPGAARRPADPRPRRAHDRPRPGPARRPAPYPLGRSPASAPSCSPPTRPRTSPPSASASSCWPAAPSGSTAPSPTSSPPRRARSGSPTSPAPTRSSAGGPAPAATTSSAVRHRPAPSPPSPRSRTPTCSCSAPTPERPRTRLTPSHRLPIPHLEQP